MSSKKFKPILEEPRPGRLFVSVSFDDPDVFMKAKKELISALGKCDYESPAFPSDDLRSIYGNVPRRTTRFLSFKRPVGRDELVSIRKKTLSIEVAHQFEGRPLIELDPGYVSEYSVTRSAIEEDFHRIYLYHGIYGENLYFFERLSFRAQNHTPTFYRKTEIITIFNDMRIIYMNDMK